MIALIRSAIGGQYGAALSMLRDCMRRADLVAWQAPVGRFPFWHVAYHTMYFTDLYLSPSLQTFQPQAFHREDYQWLGVNSSAPEKAVVASQPYDQETMMAFLDTCRLKARRVMENETEVTLGGLSEFPWLEITRLETHLYNIRHIQHHAGQLSASLQRLYGESSQWAASEPL